MMSADSVTNEFKSLLADETDDDDSSRPEFIEIVPLTRDGADPCTMECVSGDLSDNVKQENFVVKQETDDSCRLQFIEIVPLTRDADLSSTTACDSRDCSAEVKQEILPAVKQEPDDLHVSCTVVLYCMAHKTTATYCR